ncbi:MAG: hypothetical protein M3O07_07650, partial [Pseudomonadota bacterium]|nr:hypothetical protein [Pseudomonadota bacterium]
MNRLRILPLRLFAALMLVGLAACAGTPTKAAPEPLPEDTLPSNATAIAFPDEASAPPAPEPELEVPAVTDLPVAPPLYGDVLVRIRSRLALPDTDHVRIDREIEWLQRNPDYLARVFGRAQR